ncbi:zinc transporter ZIP1 isoform X1 [Papio anubis]|nr:zinc transporter ZIP1 isoform X1 [Theropithecus gelada]XP_031508930.1 zinc transporter ZIP1 isoform X1 [Papio anubis]
MERSSTQTYPVQATHEDTHDISAQPQPFWLHPLRSGVGDLASTFLRGTPAPGLRVTGATSSTMGPWEEPELLVWRPEAVASEPPVPVGLEVKLGALVLLLVLTLLCSLVPICVLRRPGANHEASASRQKALSLVSCFAGGVFLATCLLDLLPDYLAAIDEALAALHVTLQFPLQEFILAMGFFLVLVMEQITLAYKEQSGPSPLEETRALLGTVNGGPQHWHDGPGIPQASGAPASPSALRACVLVFSLALHSVFEGLAVGLQRDRARAMELCLALLLHKGILAVSLSLRLLQSHLRAQVVAGCGILFSCMTPLGIGLGAALAESAGPLHQLAQSVLEGMAAGTFLYITFLEILPQELASSEQRILKVILLLAGFALLTGLLFIQI